MTEPAIKIQELTVMRGLIAAVDGVSLDVHPGEVIAVAGPSGSGKSTLLRAVLGLAVPSSGSIALEGRVVSHGSRIRVPPEQRGLAMVFQDLALWPHLTVAGNLEFGLVSQGVPRAERGQRIAAVLNRVGLANKALVRPAALSGGERQRVALGRALVQEPRAILLDEPLANLDVLLKSEMLKFLRSILADRPCPVLYVTHDGAEAAALCDRIVVLEKGRVAQTGSLQAVAHTPATEFVRAFVKTAERL